MSPNWFNAGVGPRHPDVGSIKQLPGSSNKKPVEDHYVNLINLLLEIFTSFLF